MKYLFIILLMLFSNLTKAQLPDDQYFSSPPKDTVAAKYGWRRCLEQVMINKKWHTTIDYTFDKAGHYVHLTEFDENHKSKVIATSTYNIKNDSIWHRTDSIYIRQKLYAYAKYDDLAKKTVYERVGNSYKIPFVYNWNITILPRKTLKQQYFGVMTTVTTAQYALLGSYHNAIFTTSNFETISLLPTEQELMDSIGIFKPNAIFFSKYVFDTLPNGSIYENTRLVRCRAIDPKDSTLFIFRLDKGKHLVEMILNPKYQYPTIHKTFLHFFQQRVTVTTGSSSQYDVKYYDKSTKNTTVYHYDNAPNSWGTQWNREGCTPQNIEIYDKKGRIQEVQILYKKRIEKVLFIYNDKGLCKKEYYRNSNKPYRIATYF
jgi:hypothetical protein